MRIFSLRIGCIHVVRSLVNSCICLFKVEIYSFFFYQQKTDIIDGGEVPNSTHRE